MQRKPYTVIISALILSIIIFGYHLRIFEQDLTEASGQDFTSLWNAIWNCVITLMSTGYGDLFPKTFMGRIVGIILCFWGFIITSLLVVTVTNMLIFSKNEERAYGLLMRLYYKLELKKSAIKVL
mmetsp:Transcript_1371/g.1803  ORF Transcript_1371/g.1803 Transcript_1371/m.1803 type:complete len:125 (+) Transcript_1371:1188-1562(+)